MQPTRMHFVVVSMLVTGAYLVVGILSACMAEANTQTVIVWLASGVSFGAWIVSPRSERLTVVMATLFSATIWGRTWHSLPWAHALVFGSIETSSIILGAWLATSQYPEPTRAQKPIARAAMMVIGAITTGMIGATLANEFWRWISPMGNPASNREWRAWPSRQSWASCFWCP